MDTPKYNGQELIDGGQSYANEDGDIKPSADLEGLDNPEEAYRRQFTNRRRGAKVVEAAEIDIRLNSGNEGAIIGEYGGIISDPLVGIEENPIDSARKQICSYDAEINRVIAERDAEFPDFDKRWDDNDNNGVYQDVPEKYAEYNIKLNQLMSARELAQKELNRFIAKASSGDQE